MTLNRRVPNRVNIQLVILGVSFLLALLMGITGASQARALPAWQGDPPAETPTLAATETLTPTETAPETPTPTETSTETPLPTETATETPIPVETATETPLPAETATETPIPAETATETPIPAETATETPIPTETATETAIPIETPMPTETATPISDSVSTLAVTLRGHWKLDESSGSRMDSISQNHLQEINTVSSQPGLAGGAADFERSSSQHLALGDTAQNGLEPLNNGMTLVGWLKPETVGLEQVIAAKYDYGRNDRGYRLDLRPSNKIGFLTSANGTLQNDYKLEVVAPETLNPGTWYHLAAVFDAQQKSMSLYLNGNLIGSRTVPGGVIYDSAAPFMLGANMNNNVPALFFDGLLDEWRFYSGALSQAEIQVLRDTTLATPAPIPTDTPTAIPTDTPTAIPTDTPTLTPTATLPPAPAQILQGYWKMDELVGQRLDSSPLGHHLTNHNTVGSLPGKAGLAADFEKNQQEYFSRADGSQTGLDPLGNSFSLAGWFNPESLNDYQIIAAKYEYATNKRAYRLYLLGNNKVGLLVSPDGAAQDTYRLESTLPTVLAPGAWHHLTGVFDAQQQSLSLYLDGQLLGAQPVPFNAVYDTTAPFTLGANMYNGRPTQFFDGLLDEWRFYTGALSQADIQTLIGGLAPTATPLPVETATSTPTSTATPTNTPVPPTNTPTSTSTPTNTPVPPTNTPTQTPTSTPTPTGQPVPVGCNPSGGSGGLQVGTHKTTVAGVTAIVVVGQGYSPQTPTYLGFNLHGDGGLYTMVERSTNPLNKLANQRGWVLVSPLAPNGSSWWSNPQGDHKQALANVFEEMFAKYNLCRKHVFGTTGSGGSAFWTSQFFPEKGGQYPAHTVIGCGGNSGNSQKLNTLGKNPDIVARSTFYYVYGTEDNLVPGIRQSIQTYSAAGFRVRVNEIQGGGHCNKWRDQNLPTWHDWAATYWKDIAAELGID